MSTDTPKKSGPSINRGTSKQNYRTPDDFMEAVRKRFGRISWDLAAESSNAQHEHFYSEQDDAFKFHWHQIKDEDHESRNEGWLWLNPPFSGIEPWAEKCAAEVKQGAKILFLVPAAIGSNWYWGHVAPNAHVLALRQRICFDGKNPFPKDLLLCVFHAGLKGFQPWDWKGKRSK